MTKPYRRKLPHRRSIRVPLTTDDIAEIIGCSKRQVQLMCKAEQLKFTSDRIASLKLLLAVAEAYRSKHSLGPFLS